MHQKKKIALEMAAKISSVNGPLAKQYCRPTTHGAWVRGRMPSCHDPVMEMFHSLFIVLKISMPFSYSLLCQICDFMQRHIESYCLPRLQVENCSATLSKRH
jgi:hypothetical protein